MTDDAIDIHVPLRSHHAATLRLVVASVGAEAGFTIDELDDLKLAVSEVFNLLIEAAPDGSRQRARLRLDVDTAGLTIEIGNPEATGPVELDPLAATILSSVTDEYHVDDHGVRIIKLVRSAA
jgi:serine/threonine-protein kinase RsbW